MGIKQVESVGGPIMTHLPSTQSPYTPHTPADVESMLLDLGLQSIEELFDIPPSIQFTDSFKIPPQSEYEVKTKLKEIFEKNFSIFYILFSVRFFFEKRKATKYIIKPNI